MRIWKCIIKYPIPTWGSLTEVVIQTSCKENAKKISEIFFIEDTGKRNIEVLIEEINPNDELIISKKRNSN